MNCLNFAIRHFGNLAEREEDKFRAKTKNYELYFPPEETLGDQKNEIGIDLASLWVLSYLV